MPIGFTDRGLVRLMIAATAIEPKHRSIWLSRVAGLLEKAKKYASWKWKDGIDGRVARLIKGQSRFGAELDSLADLVNFGVAPGVILYFWGLRELGNVGWIAAMVFAICAGLRLARFNVAIDDP